jgi:fructosamine-3-kinase
VSDSSLLARIEQELTRVLGHPARIVEHTSCGGGCINAALRVRLASGESFFVKWNSDAPPDMFQREAEGLRALQKATSLRVPTPIAVSSGEEGGPAFLVLEDLRAPTGNAPRHASTNFDEELGHGLAQLHSSLGPAYGFEHDNYIGSTPQPNHWCDSWVEFFRTNRLEHLIRLLDRHGKLNSHERRLCQRFIENLDTVLDERITRPVLLHGDLWGGNVMQDGDGRPALIDPACYFGHNEADLAMTYLFGGFSERFYAAYQEILPFEDGYKERFEIYNLYHLLNHAILFGGGYFSRALAIIQRYARYR